jgi:hypothetical protein
MDRGKHIPSLSAFDHIAGRSNDQLGVDPEVAVGVIDVAGLPKTPMTSEARGTALVAPRNGRVCRWPSNTVTIGATRVFGKSSSSIQYSALAGPDLDCRAWKTRPGDEDFSITRFAPDPMHWVISCGNPSQSGTQGQPDSCSVRIRQQAPQPEGTTSVGYEKICHHPTKFWKPKSECPNRSFSAERSSPLR